LTQHKFKDIEDTSHIPFSLCYTKVQNLFNCTLLLIFA